MRVTDCTEWILIPAAVLLLAAMHRADLLVIVVPLALLVAYMLCGSAASHSSAQRKI
jgi:hypothetical protein